MFPHNGLAIRGRLDAVEGSARGDAASHKGLETSRGICGPVGEHWGPDCGETDSRMVCNEGGESGVEEEALTLIGKAVRVSDSGKSGKAATEEVNV